MKIIILINTILLILGGKVYGEWAEQTLGEMTIQEKIGQLFIVPACPRYEMEALYHVIQKFHIGSVLVKQGHPMDQVPFLNALQESAKYPLLCTGDAEWGLGMRMEETLSFPKNNIVALADDSLVYAFGKEVGEQCKLVGIHLNFAPVMDVNSNPDNPIIGTRAFGETPELVTSKGVLVIRGMQEEGTLACAKHFPGHGDVDVDSHRALPVVPHGRSHLETVEFAPFKQAVNEGVSAVMSGHLFFPELDDIFPASLSHTIMTELLQKEWGFEGLVITDALNMKALSENYSIEEVAVLALLAGHDLLLYGAHRYDDVQVLLNEVIPQAYCAIEEGVKEGRISEECIDHHVLKVLRTKEALGLHEDRMTPFPDDLMKKLHNPRAVELCEKLSYFSSSSRTSISASSMSGFSSLGGS